MSIKQSNDQNLMICAIMALKLTDCGNIDLICGYVRAGHCWCYWKRYKSLYGFKFDLFSSKYTQSYAAVR